MNDIRKYMELIKNLNSNNLINESKITKIGWSIKPEDWNFGAAVISIKDEDQRSLELVDESPIFTEDDKNILMEKYHDNCAICGHKIVNKVLFKNNDNNQILVGFDCANNVMKFRFDVAGAKKQGLRNRMQTIKLGQIQEILTNNPGLDLWLTANHYIVNNIRDNFYKYAKLSDKQIELVKKLYGERTKYEETSKPFPVGEFDGEVTITSVKLKSFQKYNDDNDYIGVYITAQHEDGWKLFGLVYDLGNYKFKLDAYNYKENDPFVKNINSYFKNLININDMYEVFKEIDDNHVWGTGSSHLDKKYKLLNDYLLDKLNGKKINIIANLKENPKDPYMAFVKGKIIIK